MLMTEDDKKRLAELERRKRKIIEEEQTRLNDFNADQRRILIFSHIFRIAPKLKHLSKRARRKLKPRVVPFNQKFFDENKAAPVDDDQAKKDKQQKSNVHLSLYHNDRSRYMQKRVPEELLRSYVANLKKRV
jgi:Na+-transporting NADH:ubiquinone oxidoreductase subunit NqrC